MDRVVVKLEQDLAPMDDGNGEEQVKSRYWSKGEEVRSENKLVAKTLASIN